MNINMKVGFIGLGTMGLPMARSLQSKGFDVVGWDSNLAALEKFGNPASSLKDIACSCDCIVTMLPEARHVEEVIQELLEYHEKKDALYIDCSTIDVENTRRFAQKLTEHRHAYVDAPVSGGREAAENSALSFMIGGHSASIERARPVLSAMGSKLIELH